MSSRTPSRYPEAPFRRVALAPGLLGAIVLLAGLALLDSDAFLAIRFVVAILAAIIAVFAWQARQWVWLPVVGAIVVLWNPVYPFAFEGQLWQGAQFLGAIAFVAAGLVIKVPNPDARPGGRPAGRPGGRPGQRGR